jgi:hypothetical protein
MEDNHKTTVDSSRYFDELLTRIRDIRSSERKALGKILDVLSTCSDYNGQFSVMHLGANFPKFNTQEAERFANKLLMIAESRAKGDVYLLCKDVEEMANEFVNDKSSQQYLYDNPSYEGDSFYDKHDDENYVILPEELRDFKGSSMVLKIEDMDRFVDTFCSRNTYYRRAYEILADLDKRILNCVETGHFSQWILISYKPDGDAIFEFSHFEIDSKEPDENFRTLYVVYRYDTTVS